MEHNEMLIVAGIIAAGIACQWLAWRIRVPAIIPLLAAGFLAGPVFGWLDPQEEFGNLFYPVISMAVAVILFEGALTLTWREVRSVASTVRNLLTVGSAVTWFGGALAAHYITGMPWTLSLLFGALIIVTGPTVIAPLLRNVRPTERISSVLKWEGILIDPIGASIAVLVLGFIVAGAEASFGSSVLAFLRIAGVGLSLGLAGGYAVYLLLHHYLVPDFLRDIVTLAVVLGVFAVSSALAAESGLLAVTVMGVLLANTDLRKLREILYFKEKLSVLLISSLFILLAANVTMGDLALLDWRSLVVLGVVILVLRPLGIFLSAWGSNLSRSERLFLSWVAPRGIVAAAVSSLFAYELVQLGIAEASILAPMTFLIIVGTVLIQGGTAKWVARALGVSEADPQGIMLMGANRLAQELGLTLQQAGIEVRLIDSNQSNVTGARLRGLKASQGNVLSDYLETTIDLAGIGRLLALTNNDEANALACKQFEDEFGSSEVYQLPPHFPERNNGAPNRFQLGRLLFEREATYPRLLELLDQGAVIKATALTEQFTWRQFQDEYAGSEGIALMAIQGKQLVIATTDRPLQPQPGWVVVHLTLARNGNGVRGATDTATDVETALLTA